MSTAAGEQKASRYYPAEEEAQMKKVCVKFADHEIAALSRGLATKSRTCDTAESHANSNRHARPLTPPNTVNPSNPVPS